MMRLFMIAALGMLSAHASSSAKPMQPLTDQPKADCPKTTAHPARRGVPLKPQKLNQLPPANAYAAVVRKVDGCEVPLILTRQPGSR